MNRRILLIEDNPHNRYLACFLLRARGWEVIEAEDGPDGLRVAADVAPAVILLDIQLPGMDGYEVARRLRANPSLAEVPIIAVTSYAMPGDREQCLAAGCTGYIEKPIDPEHFAEEVERYHAETDA
ncbi:response regulator [Thauera sp. AutoDN2]|jgi:CheY-like chemotaxis protein|uniref:response regulator n=1 Tax=Thauera sp. AutoDN2 TaxID=3416051 RepID=UPI002A377862|nr:response regulator [Thauera sp.]